MTDLPSPLASTTSERRVSSARPPGSIRVGEAVAYFSGWLSQLGKKPGNYPRIARVYMTYCLEKSYGFDAISLPLFAAGRAASQASAVRQFLLWYTAVGQPDVIADLPVKPALPVAINGLILRFIDAHHSLHSSESRATYIRVLNGFFLFLEAETERDRPDRLSERAVRSYMEVLIEKRLSAFTRRLYLTVIQQLVSWVLQQRDVHELRADQVEDLTRISLLQGPHIDTSTYYKDPLTGVERHDMLASQIDSRDRAMVALMAWGGLRTIELVRLRLCDLDLPKCRLFVQGKGKETRQVVALHDLCIEALTNFLGDEQYWPAAGALTTEQAERRLFERLTVTRSIRRKVRQFLLAMGLASKRRSAHSLRHTAAQELLNEGVDSGFVQRHLRHTNFQSTLGYTINHYEQEYIAQITRAQPTNKGETKPDLAPPQTI